MNNSSGLSPISKHGKLQVNGNRIEDSSGKVIQIRGMSLYWSQWKEKYWNEDVIRWLIKTGTSLLSGLQWQSKMADIF